MAWGGQAPGRRASLPPALAAPPAPGDVPPAPQVLREQPGASLTPEQGQCRLFGGAASTAAIHDAGRGPSSCEEGRVTTLGRQGSTHPSWGHPGGALRQRTVLRSPRAGEVSEAPGCPAGPPSTPGVQRRSAAGKAARCPVSCPLDPGPRPSRNPSSTSPSLLRVRGSRHRLLLGSLPSWAPSLRPHPGLT